MRRVLGRLSTRPSLTATFYKSNARVASSISSDASPGFTSGGCRRAITDCMKDTWTHTPMTIKTDKLAFASLQNRTAWEVRPSAASAARATPALGRAFSTREVCALQNEALKRHSMSGDTEGLLSFAEENLSTFNDVNWATMFSKLKGMSAKGEARHVARNEKFKKLLSAMERRIDDEGFDWIGTRELANIVHGLAAVGARSKVIESWICGAGVERMVTQGEPQEISSVAYAFAKLRIDASAYFEALEKHDVAEFLVTEGQPQEIANTIWSMAKLGHRAPVLASAIDSKGVVEYLVREGSPQNIANICWALATLGHEAPVLARELNRKVVAETMVKEGSIQAVANTAWAMATLGHEASALAQEINSKEFAEKLVSDGSEQAVANTMWAMATLGHETPLLAWAVDRKEVVDKLAKSHSALRCVSTIIWALASQGYEAPLLARKIDTQKYAQKLAWHGNAQQIEKTIWALKKLGYDFPKLSKELKRYNTLQEKKERRIKQGGRRAPNLCSELVTSWVRAGDWKEIQSNVAFFSGGDWAALLSELEGVKGPKGVKKDVKKDPRFEWLLRELEGSFFAGEQAEARTMDIGELVSIVCSLAAMGAQSGGVYKCTGNRTVAERIVREGKPRDIAGVARAFASVNHRAHKFFDLIETREVADKITSGSAKDIADAAFAMAVHGFAAPVLHSFMEKEEVALKIAQSESVSVIADVAWATAKQRFEAPMLCSLLERKQIANKLAKCDQSNDIARLFFALSKFTRGCPVLADCICKNRKRILRRGSAQDIATIAFAMAKLGYFEDALFDEVANKAAKIAANRVGHFSSICDTLWALATAGKLQQHRSAIEMLWSAAISRPSRGEFDDNYWRKLEITELFSKVEADYNLKTTDEYQENTDRLEPASKIAGEEAESFADDIANELAGFGYKGFRREVSSFEADEDGTLSKIDISWRDEMVLLELDGPSTLSSLQGRAGPEIEYRRTGSTMAKERFFQKIGWHFISFSFFEYGQSDAMSEETRKEMWAQLLEPCGVVPRASD